MKKIFEKGIKNIVEIIHKHLGKDSGNMIIATGIAGILLSTFAQTLAISFNKKYSLSQKSFMIPQELTDGIASAIALFIISKPIRALGVKFASTGKVLTKEMKTYMEKNNLLKERGNINFDFSKSVNNIMEKIKSSEEYIKSPTKDVFLKEHNDILNQYEIIKDSTSAITTTAGSIISTALITPLIRNYTASYYQPINIDRYNKLPQKDKDRHERIKSKFTTHRLYENNLFNI